MAIDQGTTTVSLASEERTYRINIETPKGGDPTIIVRREEIKSDANGVVVSKGPSAVVMRGLSAHATQSFTVADKTYTLAEIATVISAIADVWRTEDIAAAAADAAAAEQPPPPVAPAS